MAQCTVKGCTKDRGPRKHYCDVHYRRNRLYGDPLITKRPGLGKTPKERLDMYTKKTATCWLFTGSRKSIYGKVNDEPAHRLAYEAAYGEIPDGLVVRHKCDVPKCVRPDHLELGTYADNSMDMTERNRQAYGERQGSAILAEHEVMQIRKLYGDRSILLKEIAAQFGVTGAAIHSVATGRKWSHLPGAQKPRLKRLTSKERDEIIGRLDAGETHHSIAEDYGVSRSAVSQINRKRKRAA